MKRKIRHGFECPGCHQPTVLQFITPTIFEKVILEPKCSYCASKLMIKVEQGKGEHRGQLKVTSKVMVASQALIDALNIQLEEMHKLDKKLGIDEVLREP